MLVVLLDSIIDHFVVIDLKDLHNKNFPILYMCIHMLCMYVPGVVIITTPASPLPIELVATTENV